MEISEARKLQVTRLHTPYWDFIILSLPLHTEAFLRQPASELFVVLSTIVIKATLEDFSLRAVQSDVH